RNPSSMLNGLTTERRLASVRHDVAARSGRLPSRKFDSPFREFTDLKRSLGKEDKKLYDAYHLAGGLRFYAYASTDSSIRCVTVCKCSASASTRLETGDTTSPS